jgi:hypothetical protein
MMEALMLSVMLAICAETGLSMPNPPLEITYAPVPHEADPLVRYDPMTRTIVLDVAFREKDPEHRVLLADVLARVIKDQAKPAAAPGVVAAHGAR